MTDEEAAKVMEERRCRLDTGKCKCADGACKWVVGNFDAGIMAEWVDLASFFGVPLPALAALATGEACVVPKVLTEAMARGLEDGWVPHPDASTTVVDVWQPSWTAALAASPFKPEGGA